jgi:N-dimethylarginine dimethylaminohydrolase
VVFQVIHVVPRMVNHVLKCFSEVRGGEESVSVIAATLSMYVKHVARLDLSALHLNLAFSLLVCGGIAVAQSVIEL